MRGIIMKQTGISKRSLVGVLLLTVIVIAITRGVTLTYNRQLHPDEHVFYLGANSLLNSIVHPGMVFQEIYEYPEGSYYFHLVFQLFGKVVSNLTGIAHDIQIWGRIASVFYFTTGTLLGIRIIAKYLGKTKASVILYVLTMCFSLFFVEQSRYGVGDSISFMLLMLLISLTVQAAEPNARKEWWIASFLISGILGAVKYPQLIFVIIPLGAYLHCTKSEKSARTRFVAGYMGLCVIGFLLFSPKGMLDFGYFLRVLQSEGEAYITVGTAHEAGGVLNHLVAMLLYSILYSDFPILLPFVIWKMFSGWKVNGVQKEESTVDFLLGKIIPGICVFFFAYNLFVTLLFFRTYTPYFGIITLYTSVFAGRLFEQKGLKRIAVILLSSFMIARGSFLVYILSDGSVENRVEEQICAAVDSNWEETYIVSNYSLHSLPAKGEMQAVYSSTNINQLLNNNGCMEIQSGQLVITGAYGFHYGQEYILPVSKANQASIDTWKEFQRVNQEYLVGQAYPEAYYYLFGGWIRGGTLSQYEMPVNYIYYRK